MTRGTIISFCDRTGVMVLPWIEAGYDAITIDLQPQINPHPKRVHFVRDVTQLEPDFALRRKAVSVFCFPPCTNTAVSGARWFKAKGLDGLIQALRVVSACQKMAEISGAPWMLENPVSTIATYWRKPDYTFHPHDFTRFCLSDNYTKKTCLWTGNGFVMPAAYAAPNIGEPDDRIHKAAPSPERADFRSATPLGFARAVFFANAPHLKQEAAE